MKIAAITMAYDEMIFLPIWVGYYGRQLGMANVFVVDHGSKLEAIESLPRGVNLIRVPRSETDELVRVRFMNQLKRALQHYFDCVIYADTDEIIVADPARHESLESYCRDCAPIVAPAGLELFHAIDREKPLDLRRPVTEQRSFCQFYSSFSKPAIVKQNTEWCPGFHFCTDMPEFAEDVFTFHLKMVDMDISVQRHRLTMSMAWAESNIEKGVARHQRRSEAEHVADYFHRPAKMLERDGAAEFDFSEEVARSRRDTALDGRFYRQKMFRGSRIARIPERFRGLF